MVDNRCTDGTAARFRQWSERSDTTARLVEASERRGEPHARNVGFRAADGELIAYCDGDDVVSGTWVAAMQSGLRDNHYLTGPVDVDLLNEDWQRSVRGRALFESLAQTYGGVPFAHGCNMGFRREMLADLGGFDESFMIACDVEIAIRAWRAGVELGWQPGALVHYRLRDSLPALYRQARAYSASRPRIRQLLPEKVDHADERRARVRRAAWLARHLPTNTRRQEWARWLWVAGQLHGETAAWLKNQW